MKRQITVSYSGKIGEEAKRNYHKVLERIIVGQYRVEFAKELLEELKKQKEGEKYNVRYGFVNSWRFGQKMGS